MNEPTSLPAHPSTGLAEWLMNIGNGDPWSGISSRPLSMIERGVAITLALQGGDGMPRERLAEMGRDNGEAADLLQHMNLLIIRGLVDHDGRPVLRS